MKVVKHVLNIKIIKKIINYFEKDENINNQKSMLKSFIKNDFIIF